MLAVASLSHLPLSTFQTEKKKKINSTDDFGNCDNILQIAPILY